METILIVLAVWLLSGLILLALFSRNGETDPITVIICAVGGALMLAACAGYALIVHVPNRWNRIRAWWELRV